MFIFSGAASAATNILIMILMLFKMPLLVPPGDTIELSAGNYYEHDIT